MGVVDKATLNYMNDCPGNKPFVIPTLYFLTVQIRPTTTVNIRHRVSSSLQSQDASINTFFQYPTHFISVFYQSNKGSSINHPGEVRLLIIWYKPKAQCHDNQISESCVPKGRDTLAN